MKLSPILLLFLLLGTSLSAQEKLKVTYEAIMSLDETNSTTGKFQRNFQPTIFELIIDGNLSEYKYIEKLTSTQEGEMEPALLISGNYFIMLKENRYFVEEEIFDKKYLISDSIKTFDWKIDKNTKEIAGVSVRKATVTTDEGEKMNAWYALKLPYKVGPELYGGLPGLILELDIYFETQEKAIVGYHYKAVKIEVLNDDYQIKLPKGKTISYQESERISDEYFEKMKEMYSEGVDKD